MVGGITAPKNVLTLISETCVIRPKSRRRKWKSQRDETMGEKSRKIPSLRETVYHCRNWRWGGQWRADEGSLQKLTTIKKRGTPVLQPQDTLFSQKPEWGRKRILPSHLQRGDLVFCSEHAFSSFAVWAGWAFSK